MNVHGPSGSEFEVKTLNYFSRHLIACGEHLACFDIVSTETVPQTPEMQEDARLVRFKISFLGRTSGKVRYACNSECLPVYCDCGPAKKLASWPITSQ